MITCILAFIVGLLIGMILTTFCVSNQLKELEETITQQEETIIKLYDKIKRLEKRKV